MSKDVEKLQLLNTKFIDIQGIRDKIISEATDIASVLKKDLQAKKAASPEVMEKNLKSLSSFLENFSRMIQNLSGKVAELTANVDEVKNKLNKVQSVANSM